MRGQSFPINPTQDKFLLGRPTSSTFLLPSSSTPPPLHQKPQLSLRAHSSPVWSIHDRSQYSLYSTSGLLPTLESTTPHCAPASIRKVLINQLFEAPPPPWSTSPSKRSAS